jgi:hypothetical protein
MDLTKKFVKNPSIVYREEDDGAFLFDPETGNLKYMNHSAKEAFLMLNGQKDVSRLIQYLLTLYPDVDFKQIQKDIGSFIEQLEVNGFIFSQDGEQLI